MELLALIVVGIVVGGLILWALIQALSTAATLKAREAQVDAQLRMLRAQVNEQMHAYMEANKDADLEQASTFGAQWLTKYYGLEEGQARWIARDAIRRVCGYDPFGP